MKKLLSYIAIGLVPLLFSKCTLSEDLKKLESTANDSVQLYIGTPKFATKLHIDFIDRATGLPIDNQDIAVTLSGANSSWMYNNVGKQQSQYTAKFGMLDLVVDPHKVDTSILKTKPVEFVITPTLAGYEANPQLALLGSPKTNSIRVLMTKLSAPPAGYYNSGNVVVGNTDANGQIVGGGTINLAPRKNILRSASGSNGYSFSFEPGTRLLDSRGTPLFGVVSYEFIRNEFSNIDAPILATSGGNTRLISKYLDFSLKLFVKNPFSGSITEVVKIGGGIHFTLPIPSSLMNEATNALFAVGDNVQRWKTSELLNGSSVNDVVGLVDGVKSIQVTVDNVADLSSTWGYSAPAVFNQAHIVFDQPSPLTRRSNIKVVASVNGKPLYIEKAQLRPDPDHEMFGSDVLFGFYKYINKTVDYAFFDDNNDPSYSVTFNPSVFSWNEDNLGTNINIYESNQGSTFVNVNVDLKVVKKSSPSLAIKPNLNILVGVPGAMNVVQLVDGKTNFSLKVGQEYLVKGVFGSASGQGTISVVDNGSIYVAKFRMPIGSAPALEFTYPLAKSAGNTININYTIPVTDDVFNQIKQ